MRKIEVIRSIVSKTGIETRDVEIVIDAFIATIKKEVGDGKRIDFRGFGSFRPRIRKRKVAHDFQTNKAIQIPQKAVPHFKPSTKYFKIREVQSV